MVDDASDDDDNDVYRDVIVVYYTTSEILKIRLHYSLYAAWQVARTDLRVSKKGRVERKENKSRAVALLKGIMSLSNMKEQGN
jgi:hypothetical protein